MAKHDFAYLHDAEHFASEQRRKGYKVEVRQIKLGKVPWRVYVYRE